MDLFVFEYRNPIFGLIILFFIIFMIALCSYIWGIYSSSNERRRIEKFIKKLNSKGSLSLQHQNMLKNFDVDFSSLCLLANVFCKSGDFDKAINVYLIALEKVRNVSERELVLTELGKVYFRAGFLARSLEVFMQALELRARNSTALRHLVVVYEKLRKFDQAQEALNVLSELKVDTKAQMAYILALKALSDKKELLDKRIILAMQHVSDFSLIKRMVLQVLISEKHKIPDDFDYPELMHVVDILYYCNDRLNLSNLEYKAFYDALDGKLDINNSKLPFDIKALSSLRSCGIDAGLRFSYVCQNCKNAFPIHFYRCPMCHELGSVKIVANVSEQNIENSLPF